MSVEHGRPVLLVATLPGLACGGTSAAFGGTETGFPLRIELTRRAAETLAARREEMVMMVDYYGWPRAGRNT